LLAVALGLSLLGGFGGLLVASSLLVLPPAARSRLVPWLVSYAVGALLGVALIELLPQALSALSARRVFVTLLGGILVFFVLEKLALWRHCHTHECDVHGASGPLVLLGDAAHNFMDGAVIGAAVLTSIPMGISTAIAVLAHEIPHEVGDFAILLHAGYSRGRALAYNAIAEGAGVLGAAVAYAFLDSMPHVAPYFLSFATASFLYVAMADLIPDLHRGTFDDNAARQVLLVTAGIGTVLLL
jgi:zinc and cadmium transporter